MSNESSSCQSVTSRWEKSTNCQWQTLIALNDAMSAGRASFKGASQTAHHVSTALEISFASLNKGTSMLCIA